MLITKEVSIKIAGKNIKHYQQLGYICKVGETVLVPIEKVSIGSHVAVKVLCDYCNKNIIEKEYKNYLSQRSNNKDCCKECGHLKVSEIIQEKNKSIQKQNKIKRKVSTDEEIIQMFEKRNYKVVQILRKYNKYGIEVHYICNKHKDKGIQKKLLKEFKKGSGCYFCGREIMGRKQSGKNNNLWKGGKQSLNMFLRDVILPWKQDSLQFYNYKCIISGKSKNCDIHHVHSFYKIVEETLNFLSLPLYNNISDYSENELNSIRAKCLELHYKYGYGVVLHKSIHKLYHSIYGKDNGNIEDFIDFCFNNYKINFHVFQKDYVVNNVILKYFPFKQNASSKFYGVCSYLKHGNLRWQYKIEFNGIRHCKQGYKDEIECAYDLNNIILSIKGEKATINYLSHEELQYVENLKSSRLIA